jgi:hypothetical protein
VADKPLRWRVQDKISHLWWLQSNTDLGIKFTKVKWLMHCLDIDIPQTDLRTCLFHDESTKTTTIFKWQGKWHPWLLCVLLRPSESAALGTTEIRSPDTQRNRNSFMISAVTEEELGCTPPSVFMAQLSPLSTQELRQWMEWPDFCHVRRPAFETTTNLGKTY